jgi:hypothetical protein
VSGPRSSRGLRTNVTGVMTFNINHDGTLSEKDPGPGNDAAAWSLALYDSDPSRIAVR